MPQTIIIADDLTGANDTGAILAQNGFKVGTVLDRSHLEAFDGFNTICMSTDSRAMRATDAAAAVAGAARLFPRDAQTLYSKRIDSTLRGNVGAEIDSILDALGADYTAVVVASFPESGRTCIGDVLLVGGEPLQVTEVSRDPINPMRTSRVTTIVAEQSVHEIGYIGLEKVIGDDLDLMEEIRRQADTYRIIVVDAQTQRDIEAIAAGCAASGRKIVAIDPGPFTATLADYLFNRTKVETEQSILCIIGSPSELTQKQLSYLVEKDKPNVTTVDVARFLHAEQRDLEIERAVESIISASGEHRILCVTTVGCDGCVLDLSVPADAAGPDKRERSRLITGALAEITAMVLDRLGVRVGGLYATGGDVSVALCERLGTAGFNVENEVIPLAIYSRMIGGDRPGLHVITKGGLVGGDDTLFQCVTYLKSVID